MKNYVIVIIVILITYYNFKNNWKPESHNMCYGDKKDSLCTLIDRIDWANHYRGRIDMNYRNLNLSLLITLIILTTLNNHFPDIITFIKCCFLVFVITRAYNNYLTHHSDKFPHYGIDRNIKLLRHKLNLKRGDLDEKKYIFKGCSSACNFSFKINKHIKDDEILEK